MKPTPQLVSIAVAKLVGEPLGRELLEGCARGELVALRAIVDAIDVLRASVLAAPQDAASHAFLVALDEARAAYTASIADVTRRMH